MLKRIFFIVLLFCLAGSRAMAQSAEQEADLKAVFLYNFTKYIEWESSDNDFVIGILGNAAIDKPISEIAKTNTVNNKNIVIKHFYKLEDIGNCNILFIPTSTAYPISSILDKVGRGVLTVSEKPGMGNQGTAFNFIVKDNKLRFEANLKALNDAGLKASSQLLKLAFIINN